MGEPSYVPTPVLAEQRFSIIDNILKLPFEIQFNILNQTSQSDIIKLCLTDHNILNLCLDPYLAVIKQWTPKDLIVFQLRLLAKCNKMTVSSEIKQNCDLLKDKLNNQLSHNEEFMKNYKLIINNSKLNNIKLMSRADTMMVMESIMKSVVKSVMLNDDTQFSLMSLIKDISSISLIDKLLSIRTIDFNAAYNLPIDLSYLINLTNLICGISFNQSIDLSNLTNLIHLKFSVSFDQPVDLSDVVNLIYLDLGWNFNQPVDLSNLTNLDYLRFGTNFNQRVDLSKSINLTHLKFDDSFNQPVDLSKLINLTHLAFGNWFNQPLNLSNLINLDRLRFGNRFNQPLNLSALVNLTYISLGWILINI